MFKRRPALLLLLNLKGNWWEIHFVGNSEWGQQVGEGAEQVGFAYQMSRQFIYGQIARLDKANNAQVVLQVDIPPPHNHPNPLLLSAAACGRKDVINMKCDYGCHYVYSQP